MSNLTTNEIMFDCQVDIANKDFNTETAVKVAKFVNKYFKYNGDEKLAQENYSSDNWEAVYEWYYKYAREEMKELPLFGHHSKNPFDFIFFLWLKHPYIGFVFFPLVYLDIFIAAVKPYKMNQGTKKWERDTSGKLKAFFKMKALKMKLLKKITTYLIEKSSYYKSWENIFTIYHGIKHRVFLALEKAGDF